MDDQVRELATAAAAEAGLNSALVEAIVSVESAGRPWAVRYEPLYRWTMPQAPRPAGCTADTEAVMQRTSWGLMQIMGALARELGHEGWLTELVDAELNLRLGCAHLKRLTARFGERYGLEGVIAAYNAGSPRKKPGGQWVNQGYVDKVLAALGQSSPAKKGRRKA